MRVLRNHITVICFLSPLRCDTKMSFLAQDTRNTGLRAGKEIKDIGDIWFVVARYVVSLHLFVCCLKCCLKTHSVLKEEIYCFTEQRVPRDLSEEDFSICVEEDSNQITGEPQHGKINSGKTNDDTIQTNRLSPNSLRNLEGNL